jgi:hypothetical protein
MNKFEQLIEYVINDDEAKARELFHDIVVEKSRAIYEEMMEEEQEEETMEEAVEDDAEAMEEGMHEMGGDQADDLIDDIETEESGVSMEGEDDVEMDMDDHHADMGGEEELEDRVVDLEDKLDELMAEFESLMGGEADGEDEMDMDMDMEVGDGMSDEEVVDDELETEGMYENVDLKAAPKPVTSEEGGVNKKSTVAANSGAKGMAASPVKMTGDTAKGRSAPAVKEQPGYKGNGHYGEPGAAVKPHLAQAAGVNNKSVIQ